jgi:chemotaxis protein methyltransferase CheR
MSQPVAPRAPRAEVDDLLAGALELLDEERFAAAVEVIEAMAPDPSTHPDVVLLQGALLVHVGALERAEAVCHQLLELEARNAGAHYLIALCRDGAGDPADAERHDRHAMRLDPAFAMPRLHLGLLARRAGQPETARRELASAAELLEQEDPSRLRIFGGGFSRAALVALCRTEAIVGSGGADAA